MAFASLLHSQNIDIKLVNKSFSNGGLTWHFDLQATSLPGYTGTEDSWGTMNVRFDLAVPMGALVQASSEGSVIGNFATSAAVQPSVPGDPATGYNTEFGIFLDRTPSSNTDLLIGVPTLIASFTIDFNIQVSSMDVVDPRDPATVQGSFYVISDDVTATRKPFVLEGPKALPIKLAMFDADRYRDQNASDVRWTSVSEKNASHFELERSTDGKNFEFIANIKAEGGLDKVKEYQFIDDKLVFSRSTVNIFYYRLKMVDLDGKSDYSEVRSVRFDNTDKIDISYSPNPTANKVFVNMSTPVVDEVQNVTAVIFDLNGKQIMTRSISTNGITEIDLSHLPAASYNFNVEYAGKVFTKTIIKTN